MEPDNSSPQLDYTRLLFNRRPKANNKLNNSFTTTTATATTTTTTNNNEGHEALEVMKSLLSTQFENEIMQTCDKYMELFQRAGSNIEYNQGEYMPQLLLTSVLQSMLKSTRNAVSRRYTHFKPTGSTQRIKLRTMKVVRRKPRTLENQRMDWLKQIRRRSADHTESVEESKNLWPSVKPVDNTGKASLEQTLDTNSN